ncbi:aminotransferase class III-fold pyridoxal phosphate-dependent enzyme [Acidisoma silvae]|uniref:Aminotransferase class III-fold pyridoxal phosphate-dependent enzyme n=1 Tax=Acidisoma silvae TaxID=2802396 RepID=A0A963YTK1_9PROT|nr:aminotransferase class III-fold pyridoxal phosphate-dependent enzyme [Acidisoma silvae]MCB8876775.1 aminotransferase class III-fold pyridoxal phosphate-dependent enzyme [Acidisoma silvae]
MTSSTALVGGISSAGRALPLLDGAALQIDRSAGAYLWDDAGRRYVDTALGFGGTILGHAPEGVIAAVEKALRDGPLPAFGHAREEAAAAALAAQTGALSQVVFTNSGSEAVHLACRIARAVTGRRRVAKIAAGYDGWYDEIAFGNAGTPEADLARNSRPEQGDIVLLRYNDKADTEALFRDYPDIACVIAEPVLANAGCILPAPGYLAHLQETARRHGALFIMDEVLTGFRLHAGLTSHTMGLDPDMATVGKAIGSGIAVAGVLGKPAVMEALTDGRAIRAGTYSGNPIACAGVIATMEALKTADYPALLAAGAGLRTRIEARFNGLGMAAVTTGLNDVFTLWFTDQAPQSYGDAARVARPDLTLALHKAMRRHDALVMPSPYGRVYLSFAHLPKAVAELGDSFDAAAAELAQAA